MYIYNTILCIKSSLDQITTKLVNANVMKGVSKAASTEGTVNLTLFSPLTAVISFSQFFFFFESRENKDVWANENAQKYMCGTLPFTALQVNPAMNTSAAEKPGNVKKVY